MSWIELVAQRRPPQAPEGVTPPQNAKDWFRVENSADDPDSTDVLVYDSIGGWFGMYADEFVEALGQITTSKISLRLNSPGGSVFEGIAIANAIRSHPATVTVYVDSLAASIASVIAMSGDRLVMMPQSQIMVHNASGVCQGDAAEMIKMAELLDKQSRNIAEAYAQHTGRPLADWQQYMADETWFTAEEAVAAGLADEVMPMRPKKGEQAEDPADVSASTARTWDLTMFRYAGREQAPDPVTKADGHAVVAQHTADLNAIADAVTLPSADPKKIVVDFSMEGAGAQLLVLMRQAVREEMASLPSTELEIVTDEASEDSPETVDDTQPDDSPAATPPTDEVPAEESPPQDETPADEADDWKQLVGFLVPPTTSSCADDVFANVEEW